MPPLGRREIAGRLSWANFLFCPFHKEITMLTMNRSDGSKMVRVFAGSSLTNLMQNE